MSASLNSPFSVDAASLEILMDKDDGAAALDRFGGPTGLAKALRTDLLTGRTDHPKFKACRIETFGKNRLPPAEDVTFFELLKESLSDKMMLLLIASAIVSLILGLTMSPDSALPGTPEASAHPAAEAMPRDVISEGSNIAEDEAHGGWIEGTAILISVMIVTLVTSINNYQKEKKFKQLSATRPSTMVTIVCEGARVDIQDYELLVGDVLRIDAGVIVPADGILIEGTGLKIDESSATGENDEVEKQVDSDPVLRSGTNVLEGEGSVLITAIGVHSFAGRIAMQCREEKQDTPLQVKLEELADVIGKLGMWAAALMFVVLLLKEIHMNGYNLGKMKIKPILNMLTTAVTIVVVAVPEGLPLSVTVALAYSMLQMMQENNLVRHLAACETMGGATTICTDKTGTLTLNKMTVMRGVLGTRHFELVGEKVKDESVFRTLRQPSPLLDLFAESVAVNSSATKKKVQLSSGEETMRYVGNKTEQALLQYLEKLHFDPAKLRSAYTEKLAYPFTSAKKRMTTAVRMPDKMRFFVKGASEMILDDCAFYHNGKYIEPLTPSVRETLTNHINHMAVNRLRTIGIALLDIPGWQVRPFEPKEPPLSKFTLLGIIGIEDPIRPEVEDAVNRCKTAGVFVKMVTGDNKATAISIAKKAGIYGKVYCGPAKGEQGLAIEGKYFRELAKSERYLNNMLPRLQVLARASPLDKQILVGALKSRGEVVAVTGDGTNDAPALKGANVGFAMNTGTEVAKNASDIVILDDNFASIVTALKWGRNVNDNICKFIQFQLTVNVAAVTIAFIGALMSAKGESPLKPVQLLWLNLIMDTMAALALATEPPSDSVLRRPPKKKSADLITRRMWASVAGQAAYQIILQLWLINAGDEWFGVKRGDKLHMTIIFNVFVLMQVANEFNARILDDKLNIFAGLLRARMFLVIIFVTLTVQYIGITFAGAFMQATPLSADLWAKCLAVSVVPIPLGLLIRAIPIKEPPSVEGDYYENVEDLVWKKKMENRPPVTFSGAAKDIISLLKITGAMTSKLRKKVQ